MKLLVLDGNSIINRAFYGVRPLTTRDGRPTGAVYGFLTMFNRMLADEQPDAVAVAFDMRAPTFRHKKYAGYKAGRKGMPDELAAQLQPLKDVISALGYRIVTAEGWEADDIIGTLARSCTESGQPCVIATGDRDTLQLVSDSVAVRLLSTKNGQPIVTKYDVEAIGEAYGVKPEQLKDIKAIQGDSSDNIPGVAGIGEKGAKTLVARFGSLDEIYDNIYSADIKEGTRKKLEAGKESAYLSYWLGTIQTDAPVPLDIAEYVPAQPDSLRVRTLMTDLELFSLLKKLDLPEGNSPAPSVSENDSNANDINVSYSDGAECVKLARESKHADFVYSLIGQAEDGKYIPNEDDFVALCVSSPIPAVHLLSGEDAWAFVSQIVVDSSIAKRTYDLKRLARICLSVELYPAGFTMDTMLAAYLINPSSSDYTLERLTEQYLGVAPFELPVFLSKAKQAVRFCKLCDTLTASVEQAGMVPLLRDIELPLSIVLADMEMVGFMVDSKGITEFGGVIDKRAEEIQKSIWEQVGEQINLNSPKQLGEALFVKLGLPGGKKTKTGYSTGAEVLEGLRGVHPVVDMILEYRMLTKLSSTYCKGLTKCVGEDSRIHTSFNQTETRTGRISSTEPNLQNIPVRTELGRELRRFFTAPEGGVLIDADYSQIELRVLAHMAHDEVMIKAFNDGTDIHRVTAAQVFGVAEDEVTPTMRSNAKAVNFGIVYGISAFSLGKDIGVSTKEAQRYIDGYLATYSGVSRYMDETVATAKKDGYVQTLYGRRRYLPELTSSNFNVRSFGERVARNMPIQGTAADIIKTAMIRVHDRLRNEGMKARLIMQVHDELIIEAPEGECEAACRILGEEMKGAAEMAVELLSETHAGRTWLDAK